MAVEYQYPNEEKQLIELGNDYRIIPTNFLYQPIGVYSKNITPEDKFYWGGTGLLLTPEITLDLSESVITYPNGQSVYSYFWRYLAPGYRLTRVSANPTANMYIKWELSIQSSHACQQLIYGGGNQWQYPIVGEVNYSQIGNANNFFKTRSGGFQQRREYEAFGKQISEILPYFTLSEPGRFHRVTTDRTFYKFEVLFNEEVIFTRTELEQPEVNLVGLCPLTLAL